jgi:hypothetical protein
VVDGRLSISDVGGGGGRGMVLGSETSASRVSGRVHHGAGSLRQIAIKFELHRIQTDGSRRGGAGKTGNTITWLVRVSEADHHHLLPGIHKDCTQTVQLSRYDIPVSNKARLGMPVLNRACLLARILSVPAIPPDPSV